MNTEALSDASRSGNTTQVMDMLNSFRNISQAKLNEALEAAIWAGPGNGEVVGLLLSHRALITTLAFRGATNKSDVEVFRQFFNHGWDPNSIEYGGEPALRLVVDDEICVSWLLEHGADPNKQGAKKITALATAALCSSTTTIDMLITKGAEFGGTALYNATNVRGEGGIPVMKCLIDHGLDINAPSSYGSYGPPLFLAVHQGAIERVQFLLDNGADLKLTFNKITAAEKASAMGKMRSEIYAILANGEDHST